MSNKLKPCPFCGCSATGYSNVLATTVVHGVTCMNCTAKVFGFATQELAVNRWNKRVPETVVNQYGENCTNITNVGTLNLEL